MRYSFYCLFFMLMLFLFSCSNPQQNNSAIINQSAQKEAIDTADKRLANDLSIFCTSQIEAARLASTKASNQKVKEFGKQAAELYTSLNKRLNLISENYDIKLPVTVSASTEKLQKLTVIKGSSFDHAYLLQMLKDHNITIREINAAKNIQCMPLKHFVISNQADIIKQAYALADLKAQTL